MSLRATAVRCRRHQRAAQRDQPRARSHSAVTTSRPRWTRPTPHSGGLGPELARFFKGGSNLAIDAKANLAELDEPDRQRGARSSKRRPTLRIPSQAWAAHLATVTDQLKTNDAAVRGTLQGAPGAAEETARTLRPRASRRCRWCWRIWSRWATSHWRTSPTSNTCWFCCRTGTEAIQGVGVPNRNTKQDYNGAFLSFNLNLNIPPACTTGFLPAQQQRSTALEDYPRATARRLYCRCPRMPRSMSVGSATSRA